MDSVSKRSDTSKIAVVLRPSARRDLLRLFSTVLILTGVIAYPAAAQNYLTSTGSPSFAAPEPVELGSVDAASGDLHLSLPLGSYPQRATSQPEAIVLEYDSNIWAPYVISGITEWQPKNGPGAHLAGGWYYSFEASGEQPGQVAQGCYTDQSWADQNGSVHWFHLNLSYVGGQGCPSTAAAYATDSSGYYMDSTSTDLEVYAPDGTLAYSEAQRDPQGRIILGKDSNGNYMSWNNSCSSNSIYDTLGRQIIAGASTICGGTTLQVSTSQGTAQYTLSFSTINVNTNFQQSGVQETSTQITVIRSLTLPGAAGTYYFTYDCDSTSGNSACGSPHGQSAYYGELISTTLPTGGQVNYYYTTFKDAYGNMSQWVNERVSAGGIWDYFPQVLSTCSPTGVNCQQQTTVSTPAGATTVYTFQLNNGAWPITIVKKDSSGNALTTVSNTWDFSQSCVLIGCHGANFVRLLTQQTTVYTPGGSLKKQVSYTYDTPQTGNQTAIKEWKYISSGSFASVPDRATYIAYLTTGINNINRPLSVALCNNSGSASACSGAGSVVTQKLYTYDSYGSSGLTSITGIAQHDDTNFGVSYATRGNVTLEEQWVSGSTYLTASYTYDTTGQVLTQTDPAGNITTNSYADSFFTDGGNGTTPTPYSPSQPTNAYQTKITDAVGSQTMGYYWGSGKMSIATDYNSVSTYSHYQDGLDRQTEELDPIGWKLATYSSATQSDMYTAVGDTSPSTGCSSCQHVQAILDSWGRTSSQNLVNNPIGQVSVVSAYDTSGRLATQSHPNTGSGDPNDVVETFGYDSLDRKISTTHADGEEQQADFGASVGGLGGLSAQQGSTSTYGYGYPQISEDEAHNQRQQWVDGFGRIIEVDEPSASTSTIATTTVSISGGQQWVTECEPSPQNCIQQVDIPNTGYVYLTVGTYTANAMYSPDGNNYPGYETTSQVASALAAYFNGDPNSPVTASASGSSILLTAKGPGSSGNLAFSSSETWSSQLCGSSPCFTGPGFSISPSSGSLSGGSGGIDSSPYYTNYIYDVADHLTQVVQGAQTRTFQYDGLGRKISEATPEGGTVTYSYTASGGGLCSGDSSNVCQRTDARGVVTTYTYDHANRLTGASYFIPNGKGIAPMPTACTTTPNGTSANVCYYYDQGGATAYAIGRLTEMIDPTGSETTTYNNDGRVTQVAKVTGGQTYTIGYQYDTGGDVTQITYPSGHVVYQTYNVIGQLCLISPSLSSCGGSGYYASIPVSSHPANNGYDSPGHLISLTYGNGVVATFGYSAPRMQLSSLNYAFGSSTYFNLGYWYQQNSPNCPNGTAYNNGAIQCITDGVNSGRTANYGYDSLGRIISAKSNGSSGYPQWGLSESYDRYGNRLSQTVTAGSGPSSNLSFSSNNQPTGYTFDASGNMTVEPLTPPNDMTYDGENRMTAFSGNGGAATYTYDGNGLRVVKSIQGGTTTVSIFAGSSIIDEYDGTAPPSTPSREYIYNSAGGATTGLLAMIVTGGATTYYHQDHLSVRLTTNSSGSILTQEGAFPFGEQWYESGSTNKWFFTSYDRDSESGLDYALARYYDSRTGTFCSADPLAGDPSDPQSWNRYPYGRNDPIDVTDPSGKGWVSWLVDIGIGITAGLLGPEIAPALFGAAGGATFGSSTMTILETGWSSTTNFMWATPAVFGGGMGALLKGANSPDKASQPPAQIQHSVNDAKIKNPNCPSIPPHPDFDNMNQDIDTLNKQNPVNRLVNFKKLEEKGAPWDFKRINPAWDDFGNFHYGYVGSGIGYSDSTLMKAAGYIYWRDHPATRGQYGNPFTGGGNYGEPPDKAATIRNGIEAQKKDCKYN